MTGAESPLPTRYSVRQARKERRSRLLLWSLIGAACAVIVVFAVLFLMGGGG
jgi:type VI protein secretion system component VasF